MNRAASGDEHRLYAGTSAEIRPLATRRQVLALSGGGFRGLFAARILERIEETFGGRIRDHFHLCVGTSAGGMIAAAVAHGIEAAAIRDAFERGGPVIFRRTPFSRLYRIFRAPYGVVGLNSTIDRLFGRERTLLDAPLAELPLPLIVTAVGVRSREPKILGGKGLGDGRHPKVTLREAILGSAAAPTYFPAFLPRSAEPLVDGGLVANAPELVALAYGRKAFACGLEDLCVMGLGTAAPDPAHAEDDDLRRGGLRWLLSRRGLVQLTLGSQEALSVRLAGLLVGDRYLRVDCSPAPEQAKTIGLDLAGPKAAKVLLELADQCFAGFQRRADFKRYFLRV
jgi:predicted acylesterase/phospholipase RssA